MRKYVVEYRYQTDYMADEAYDVCVVDAESEEDAAWKAERESGSGWQGVDAITPCEDHERDFAVDLCDGDSIVASFIVKGFFPIAGKAGGEPYRLMIGAAKSKAIEEVKEKHPEFFAKVQSLHGHPDGFYHLSYDDIMIIVRPTTWIKDGTRAYEVRVDYEDAGGKSYFYETVRGTNHDDAVRIGSESVRQRYQCKVLAAKAVRIAEPPSMQHT